VNTPVPYTPMRMGLRLAADICGGVPVAASVIVPATVPARSSRICGALVGAPA